MTPGGFTTDPNACPTCGMVMCEGHPDEPTAQDLDREPAWGWLPPGLDDIAKGLAQGAKGGGTKA